MPFLPSNDPTIQTKKRNGVNLSEDRDVKRMATHDLLPGKNAQAGKLTDGQRSKLSKRVAVQYAHYQDSFDRWCLRRGLDVLPTSLDQRLADYLDTLLFDGVQATEGEKVLAAIVFREPQLRAANLIQSQETLKGFRKRHPGRSRPGLPRHVVHAIALEGMSEEPMFTVAVLVCKECYLRPLELLAVTPETIGKPVPGAVGGLANVTVTVAPQELGIPSKTGVFDESIQIDSPVWLGPLIQHLAIRSQPQMPLFQMNSDRFQKVWKGACIRLGIVAHVYQLRHSGASDDALERRRTPLEIMARGRWKTLKSLERYKKPGPVQKSWGKLDPVRQRVFLSATNTFALGFPSHRIVQAPSANLSSPKVVRLDV